MSAKLAWFEPEILAIPKATLEKYQENNTELKPYQHYFEVLNKKIMFLQQKKKPFWLVQDPFLKFLLMFLES